MKLKHVVLHLSNKTMPDETGARNVDPALPKMSHVTRPFFAVCQKVAYNENFFLYRWQRNPDQTRWMPM